jgi:hypothetical protein
MISTDELELPQKNDILFALKRRWDSHTGAIAEIDLDEVNTEWLDNMMRDLIFMSAVYKNLLKNNEMGQGFISTIQALYKEVVATGEHIDDCTEAQGTLKPFLAYLPRRFTFVIIESHNQAQGARNRATPDATPPLPTAAR